VRTIS